MCFLKDFEFTDRERCVSTKRVSGLVDRLQTGEGIVSSMSSLEEYIWDRGNT